MTARPPPAGRPRARPPSALLVAAAAGLALLVGLVLPAGAPFGESPGAVTPGPGPGWILPGAARGGVSPGPADSPTVDVAAGPSGGAPGASAAPGDAAAPPALVTGRGGTLAEAPAGLAGRAATQRGSPAEVPWERVRVFARVSELGKLARPVASGLAAARDRMRPCFAEERRALAAGREPPFDPADPPTGPAILILDLQTRPGGVDVVSANVESLGTSTAELAGCAAQVLSGYAIDAPAAPGGKRFRLLHTLQ